MSSFNSVFLIGNLTRDPVVRFTQTRKLVCEFTVAVKTKTMEAGEVEGSADFIPVNAWEKLGHQCHERLVKGSKVRLEGHLKAKRWTDHKTQENHSRLVVVARDVDFVARLREGPAPGLVAPADAGA